MPQPMMIQYNGMQPPQYYQQQQQQQHADGRRHRAPPTAAASMTATSTMPTYSSPARGQQHHLHQQHRFQQQQQQQQHYHPMMMNFNAGGFAISHEEVMLLQQLKHQVEFYFSEKNLQNDTYLLNQLNATDHIGAVSVETICNFPKIRELVRNFYATRMGLVVTGPPPMAPPYLLQTALRLEFVTPAGVIPKTDIVTLSDDGLWISPTKQLHIASTTGLGELGQTRQDSNDAGASSDLPPVAVGGGGSASSLTTISGIGGAEGGGSMEKEGGTPTSGASSKDGGGASVPTVSTGISTTGTASAPSSPSSQASSVGVKTHPLPQKERNIVIVRDMPTDVKLEDVISAFSTVSIKPISARPDVGKTWYVTFETKDDAVTALLESNGKTIAGVPIQGRLKIEILAGAPTTKPVAPLATSTLERSNSSTSNNTGTGPTGPPPIIPLPPPPQEITPVEGPPKGTTDNDDSGTDSLSSSVRLTSNAGVTSHPPVHLTNLYAQHIQNQFPVYPQHTYHQQQVGGVPPYPMSLPPHGYGFVSPQQLYGMAHAFLPNNNRVHFYPPHNSSYPGMQHQQYIAQQQQQQLMMHHHQNQQRHHHQQQQRQPNSQGSYRSRQQQHIQQPRQQQQQAQRSTRSVSSATDHSQLDGSQRQSSPSTPPQHVFLKHDPSKNKNRDTIDGSNQIPQQLRASNESQPDQLGPRPPTARQKKKRNGKKNAKNKPMQTVANTNNSDRDNDVVSVSSRNSRRSNNGNNNQKKNADKSKQNEEGPPAKKDNKHSTPPTTDQGTAGKGRRRNSQNGPSKSNEDTSDNKATYASNNKKIDTSRSEKKSEGGAGTKSKNPKSGGPTSFINVSDFPALSGQTTGAGKATVGSNGASKRTGEEPRTTTTGYAQALLKKPPAAAATPATPTAIASPSTDTEKRVAVET